MSTLAHTMPGHRVLGVSRERLASDHAYQAFTLLRIGFTVAPILAGLDKFFNLLVNWEQYLAPWIANLAPVSPTTFMMIAGVIEIVAGLVVAVKPRFGGFLVAAWLAGIIVNLLSFPGWYDIALRDLGLLIGAFSLGLMALRYDTPAFETSASAA